MPDPVSIPFTRVLVKTFEGGSFVPSKSHDKSVDSGIGRYFSSYLPYRRVSLLAHGTFMAVLAAGVILIRLFVPNNEWYVTKMKMKNRESRCWVLANQVKISLESANYWVIEAAGQILHPKAKRTSQFNAQMKVARQVSNSGVTIT